MTMRKRYGALLRERRKELDIRQKELAERAGCSRWIIQMCESEKTDHFPLPELRRRFAEVLGDFYEERVMLKKPNGFFITFESTSEGLGKSTQARRLAANLLAAQHDTILTRELGGTQVGQKLREMLLDATAAVDLAPATELFIVMADRAQHYAEVLKPSLMAGKIVVSDRFADTTSIYQGWGKGWKASILSELHQHATGSLIPDLTIVLDGTTFRPIPNDDRFENLGEGFFSKVKRGMLDIAAKNPQRCVLLNANEGDEDFMAQKIFSIVQERLRLSQK